MTDRAADLSERLAGRTLELVDVSSVSRDEFDILRRLDALRPLGFVVADAQDAARFWVPAPRRPDAPFVVLAGHVDTVSVAGNVPGWRDSTQVVGRGAADMKGGVAVMLEVAAAIAAGANTSDVDLGFLFFGREELPIGESALLPLLERCEAARAIDLAIVMEPTDNRLELGCLGNLNVRVVAHGVAAHTARPWLGRNAIHAAIASLAPLADLPIRDVEIDGLRFREVVSVTSIEGGIAGNVVPDRAVAQVNLRYAPTHTPQEAEARLRELLGPHDVEVEVVGNAPPARPAARHPLVARLGRAGGLETAPKQAWTPVAEFAATNIDAVNFGPGDPQYAHRDDERVEVASLVRSFEVLRAFLEGVVAVEG